VIDTRQQRWNIDPRVTPVPIDPPHKRRRKRKIDPPPYDPMGSAVQTLPFSLWDLKALLIYLGEDALASRLP
jgi:hypothetical protein